MPPIRLIFREKQYVQAIEKLRAQQNRNAAEAALAEEEYLVYPGVRREDITDAMLRMHAAIRIRGRSGYELQFRRSRQFRGEKYVGTYDSPASAMEAVRTILESDNHLAAIARLYEANPRKRSGAKPPRIKREGDGTAAEASAAKSISGGITSL